MKRKVRVAILCGGRSAEHEVSLQSAFNIIEAIDRDKYEPFLIGIDRQGGWHLYEASAFLRRPDDTGAVALREPGNRVMLLGSEGKGRVVDVTSGHVLATVDAVFPILHGPMGEDGTVQGLLMLAGLPFVGSDVLGSAVAMDKDVSKRLLRDAGLPTVPYRAFERSARDRIDHRELERELGQILFVKPAGLGSSVGISKASDGEAFARAVEEAFSYGNKVIIESFVEGREIECSVLGNEDPIASVPGEIVPHHGYYSYEAKYLDPDGARLEIPASLSDEETKEAQTLAVKAFAALCCRGMARVDFFRRPNGAFVVNEINTIPGFTRISMYPKLWDASGIPYAALIDRLIDLAMERFESDRRLRMTL